MLAHANPLFGKIEVDIKNFNRQSLDDCTEQELEYAFPMIVNAPGDVHDGVDLLLIRHYVTEYPEIMAAILNNKYIVQEEYFYLEDSNGQTVIVEDDTSTSNSTNQASEGAANEAEEIIIVYEEKDESSIKK